MPILPHSLSLAAVLSIAGLAQGQQKLRPASELVSNCYNFPKESFDSFNNVKATYKSSPHLVMETGSPAIDFTLHDIDGNEWNLRQALQNGNGKPVAIIWGMSTCPAYEGLDSEGSDFRWTYWNEIELVESHGDKATFVHLYGPEPHPTAPDLNFDSGRLLPNYWSTTRQQLKYEDRVQAATAIRGTTHPDQVILPDYLDGNPYNSQLNQPVWCSYAMGARPAVLIGASGTIFFQQEWLNTDELGEAIDAYWSQDGDATWKSAHHSGSSGSKRARRVKERETGVEREGIPEKLVEEAP